MKLFPGFGDIPLKHEPFGNRATKRWTAGIKAAFLSGGAGNDVFDFVTMADSTHGRSIDKVQDFAPGQEKLHLASFDANTALAGEQAFTRAGMGLPAVAKAGNLFAQSFAAAVSTPAYVRVCGDVNGDNVADFAIDGTGVTSLDASAFIL